LSGNREYESVFFNGLARQGGAGDGGSRGIGAAIALAFAREGATVAINYLSNDEAAASTVDACLAAGKDSGGDAWAVKADVGSPDAVQSMVDGIVREAGASISWSTTPSGPMHSIPNAAAGLTICNGRTIRPSSTGP
jgi:NAD(P)-dependent dehydrogenase (short-subunit alcohol dehydrogenase family)